MQETNNKADELAIDNFGECPLPITGHETVQLAHGSGGKMMNQLIDRLFLWAFNNEKLNQLDDQAVFNVEEGCMAFSTDSFVIDPIFFPGGDIGELAVNGTVNDVAMCGAKPLYLSAGFIIEEGFPLSDLKRIVISMRDSAAKAGVKVVTGDTKVVNKGQADKIFINTAGIGCLEIDFQISSHNLQPGDNLIVSGSVADHGMAVLSRREGLAFDMPIESDTAALNGLIEQMLQVGGEAIHAMRDPTRGGLAATLNEFAINSEVGIKIAQTRIPLKKEVAGACEILGLDPLYVANEGKLVVAVAEEKTKAVLAAMQAHELGRDAAIIGKVVAEDSGRVHVQTRIGAWRILDMLVGEQLPRIC